MSILIPKSRVSDQSPPQNNIVFRNSVVMGGTYTVHNVNEKPPRDPLRILQEASSPSAFHNSGERYDPPRCHENTRVAVLNKIMDWILGCDPETRDKWIMLLCGGAGAGKSAIAQTLAERCDAEGRLLASFFFGRSDGSRNNAKSLIPTIACQIYANVPGARRDIASVINDDPLIFDKSLLIQLVLLVIEPLKCLGDTVSQHLIIIDGLDECLDRVSQVTILRTLFDAIQKYSCRIRFLVASRPEHDIVNTFSSCNVEVTLARLVLDDGYEPLEDIRLFLNDKFESIAETHPFKNLIPTEWPGVHVIWEIAQKSSGQFVYASTVIKYIESLRHRPDHRLEIIRNLRPRKGDSDLPFAELDALYTHILSFIENQSLVVEILSFIIHEAQAERFSRGYTILSGARLIEEIHELEAGCLQILLCDIAALITVEKNPTGEDSITVLHVSILDFLIDPSRSKDLHIPGNLLITKHVTNCLRFLFKTTDNGNLNTEIVVKFLVHYCGQVSFTEDMASVFDGFSLLKFFQRNTTYQSIKYSFLLRLNPVLLELIRRSNQRRFLSRYLTMLDEFYIALLDRYPAEPLALQLSILIHENTFPFLATTAAYGLSPFREEEDTLWIVPGHYFGTRSHAEQPVFKGHRAALRNFLLDPVRSRHYNFQSSSGKMYVKSLLACFRYLDKQLFRYHYCPHCSTAGLQLVPFTAEEAEEVLNTAFDNEETGDAIGAKWEEHQTTREDWAKYFLNSPEDTDIVDTEKDIQAWYQHWHHEVVISKENQDKLEHLSLGPRPDSLRRMWLGRYGLMLGYMIYFFPRAGKSHELIELCKTTVLRRDLTLFPMDTVRAQRAMAAYVKRVETLKNGEYIRKTTGLLMRLVKKKPKRAS